YELKSGFGCGTMSLQWRAPADQIPDGYNVYRRIDQGEWEIRNQEPLIDSSFIDSEIIYETDLFFGVTSVYGELESSLLISDPINIPDPASVDCLIVGDTTSEELNLWYKSILDSLGLNTRIVGDILPYCGERLANLPVLWLVSMPGETGPLDSEDRETAITDYLDNGGRLFIHDGWMTFSQTICDEYLMYGYTTCTIPGFIYVDGYPGTFAEGLSFEYPDTIGASYLVPFGDSCEILLDDHRYCSCVAVVTDRLGFKAVINSQRLDELPDGPNGTRLDFFNRMLNFFDMQTNLDENETPFIPTDQIILSAYPNPFNAQVRLSISGVSATGYRIEIYDITGRLVRRFADVNSDIVWDGRGTDGESVSSGIYFARVSDDSGISSSIKLTLLK
ncbi:MAG: T9SS type A sorting domain-containing protein, partial [candidate division Zixibacteria bacterium]